MLLYLLTVGITWFYCIAEDPIFLPRSALDVSLPSCTTESVALLFFTAENVTPAASSAQDITPSSPAGGVAPFSILLHT